MANLYREGFEPSGFRQKVSDCYVISFSFSRLSLSQVGVMFGAETGFFGERVCPLVDAAARRTGLGSGVRAETSNGVTPVRTMTMGCPQHGQVIGGRGMGVVSAGGLVGSRICSKAISRLRLGCRKPKLRARRNLLGRTWRSSSARKRAPVSVR